MKAMILAAGLGTRLRPLTNERPKALMPVVNKPIIARVTDYLKAYGVRDIVVNVHHHHQQIIDYLDRGRPFGVSIELRFEPEILGTGGGIKNTEDFWDDEPFIVINGDILTDIDLKKAYEDHKSSGALATLVLHDCKPFNQIRLDNNKNIIDIAPKKGSNRLAFTGIHIIDPEVLKNIPQGIFSNIIDSYRELMIQQGRVKAHVSEKHYWKDIGSIESYFQANKELSEEAATIGEKSQIDPGAGLEEWAVVGENCRLEKNTKIKRSIIWDHVRLKEGVKVLDSIVTSGKVVERDLVEEIF